MDHTRVMVDDLMENRDFARKLLVHGFNPRKLRLNSLLEYDEWKEIDDAVAKAARLRMKVTKEVLERGLTKALSDDLGVKVLASQKANFPTNAAMDMDADTETSKDRREVDIDLLPIPIVHAGFWLSIRDLRASRNNTGHIDIDTTLAEECGMAVMEKIEENFVQGTSTYTHAGGSIYGLEDAPNKNTVTKTTDWDDSGSTPVDDVRSMKQALINDRHYGPYVLFVPTAYETVLDDDHATGYPKTVRQRILEIDGIEAVHVVDKLTADTVILVQMTQNVIRAVTGFGGTLQTVEWESQGGMRVHYKVMGIIVPQIRDDYNSRSGVCVCT